MILNSRAVFFIDRTWSWHDSGAYLLCAITHCETWSNFADQQFRVFNTFPGFQSLIMLWVWNSYKEALSPLIKEVDWCCCFSFYLTSVKKQFLVCNIYSSCGAVSFMFISCLESEMPKWENIFTVGLL